MLFGASPVQAVAATSAIGTLMPAENEKERLRSKFQCSGTAAAATTGMLIPPSKYS